MERCSLLAQVDTEREELLAVCRLPPPQAEGAEMQLQEEAGEERGLCLQYLFKWGQQGAVFARMQAQQLVRREAEGLLARWWRPQLGCCG